MKKLLLLPLLLFTPLFALPIGNPMDASLYSNGLFWDDCYDQCCDPCDPCFDWCNAWSLRIGFYGDYVYNRHMEVDASGRNSDDINDFEITTNAGFLALNICDRLDIFTTLGASQFRLWNNPLSFATSTVNGSQDHSNLETNTDFSWSIGGRLTIWSCDCFYFGIEGQYFYANTDVKYANIDFTSINYIDDFASLKYKEWQVGIGVAYLAQIGCSGISAIPYMGLKWAGSHADFGNARPQPVTNPTFTLFDLENKKSIGYGVGFTLLFCDALSLTAEGRFGDEKAFHVNGQFRF